MLSASSYKLARRCLRRWALKEVCRVKEPPTKATEFGTRAHEMLEKLLRDGTAIDVNCPEGRLAVESIPHLPKIGSAEVEVPFAFELDGAWFYGFIDVVDAMNARKIDHKFVSGLDYAETPESLRADPAAVLYTLAEPSFGITKLRWIYNLKKRKKGQKRSNPVDAELSLAAAKAYAVEHLVPAWRLLNGIRGDVFGGTAPEDAINSINIVPCNPEDCMAFGKPCPGLGLGCTREGVKSLKEIISDE